MTVWPGEFVSYLACESRRSRWQCQERLHAARRRLTDFFGPVHWSVDISMTTTRTQNWSTTIETYLGFEDILSLGVSFSSEFSESSSDSEAANFFIPDGESGYVARTSYARCTEGV